MLLNGLSLLFLLVLEISGSDYGLFNGLLSLQELDHRREQILELRLVEGI